MLQELSRREVRKRILPDPDIDAYMKAAAISGRQHSVVTDYIQKILGLDICADTIVGNEMLRGISGGQRKRVTTGEAADFWKLEKGWLTRQGLGVREGVIVGARCG